jgi:hypothetical protein
MAMVILLRRLNRENSDYTPQALTSFALAFDLRIKSMLNPYLRITKSEVRPAEATEGGGTLLILIHQKFPK